MFRTLLSNVIGKCSAPASERRPIHSHAQSLSAVCLFNSGTRAHSFYIEPWGADYTLAAGEHCELVVTTQRDPWFLLETDSRDATQVWCEEAETYEIRQCGSILDCGHNRHLTER